MRWWASLRQAYPSRSPLILGVLVLLFCLLVGGVLIGGATAAIHLTSTESFCISCHELRDNAYAEFKDTSHDKNRTGVRAECADCHLPKEFVPMMVRKIEAARARHAKAKAEGTTCIDCHFGLAHKEPDGPGPREIKVSR